MSVVLMPKLRQPLRLPAPASGPDDVLPNSSTDFMQQVVTVLPDIWRCARQLARDRYDADDLVQETCRRAIEARDTFAPGSSLRAWMLCILRNHHRDGMRRARREVFMGDQIESLPAEGIEDVADWAVISHSDATLALESLPPVFRTTYALHAIRGLSYLEIARRLGIPCGTVGTRLRRARLRLRRILLGRCGDTDGAPETRSNSGSAAAAVVSIVA